MIQVVEVPNVSWEDIGGLENVKRELQEVIGFVALCSMFEDTSLICLLDSLFIYGHADCSVPSGAS